MKEEERNKLLAMEIGNMRSVKLSTMDRIRNNEIRRLIGGEEIMLE
jgi:hypothetical protein